MKHILTLVFLFAVFACLGQPTGYQKLFLEISEQGDTIHFENRFNESTVDRQVKIIYRGYELKDISTNATGFAYHQSRPYIYKTLMTRNHRLQLIKNKTDTMDIEILNAFNVYFLHISFQKGKFRLYVNDGAEHRWLINTLPFKNIEGYQTVYDITPPNWNVFMIDARKSPEDYFISNQFKRSNILAKSILPEDDPNFRNPRRVNHLKVELGDYNFDGQQDYREQKWTDTTKRNYFIWHPGSNGYVLDTLLSSLDFTYFDFEKRIFIGRKETRVDQLTMQSNIYEFREGKFTLVRQQICHHAFPHSEKIDCSVYEWIDGKWVFKETILGAE